MEWHSKDIILKDGTKVHIRALNIDDAKNLFKFFSELSPEDKQFIPLELSSIDDVKYFIEEIESGWMTHLIAEFDGRIIAEATLMLSKNFWSRHIGDFWVIVDPKFRNRGLGLSFIREILFLAARKGLDIIQTKVLDHQTVVIKACEKLGFRKVAVLSNHAIDPDGNKRNLIILSYDLDELWHKMEEFVEDYSFHQEI